MCLQFGPFSIHLLDDAMRYACKFRRIQQWPTHIQQKQSAFPENTTKKKRTTSVFECIFREINFDFFSFAEIRPQIYRQTNWLRSLLSSEYSNFNFQEESYWKHFVYGGYMICSEIKFAKRNVNNSGQNSNICFVAVFFRFLSLFRAVFLFRTRSRNVWFDGKLILGRVFF